MRILEVVQRPQRRGAEVFASELSVELRGRSHSVRIVYLYSYDGGAALPVSADDFMFGSRSSNLTERAPGVNPRLLRRLVKELDRYRPDVVQLNGGRTNKYGALASRLRPNRRWALVSRNIGDPLEWITGRARRELYGRVIIPSYDGIVGVSQVTLDRLGEVAPIRVPTTVIPRAVSPAHLRADPPLHTRTAMGVGEGQPVLVFAGAFTPEKRVDRLLEVVAAVRRKAPDVCLWLLGDGPLRGALEQSDAARELGGAATFLGMRSDVASYLHAADILMLLSDTEGVPGSILEAGFLGTPAVATRVGGVASCVKDTETGLLFDREDTAGMVEAIIALLGDPARQRAMGAAAKVWVEENYLIDVAARRYEEFYGEVLRAKTNALSHAGRAGSGERRRIKGRGLFLSVTAP